MCRLAAYWGRPVGVAELIVDTPHSLLRQCTDAREQTSGCTNPDGWGIGWWADGDAEPHRYRTATPMPADRAGLELLTGLRSGRFVAHVRLKSPGSPTEPEGNAPFRSGPWLFAHNGFVAGYREGAREDLLDQLSPARRRGLEGDVDSEVLFGLVLDRLDAGDDPVAALAGVVGPLARHGGRYNVMLTDGTRLVATCLGNSLHHRWNDRLQGHEVVSEPYDAEPGWQALDDGTVVELDGRGPTITDLQTVSSS